MNAPLEHATLLVRKARHDIMMAERGLPEAELSETVCFHAQQAVEKSLKALLALDDVEYPYTHNLKVLVELVGPRYPTMRELADRIVPLTPYAINGRYGGLEEPDAQQAAAALETAKDVYARAEKVVAERAEAAEGESEDGE